MSNSAHVRCAEDARVARVRRRLVSAEGARELAETFSLLGDATRTRILHALAVDELCVSELAELLGISPSATSHQLRLLRDRRLVAVRRDGKRTYYRLEDEHIRTLVDMGISHAEEYGRSGLRRAPAAARRVRSAPPSSARRAGRARLRPRPPGSGRP